MSDTEMVSFWRLWHMPLGGGDARPCVQSPLTEEDANNLAVTLNQLAEAAGDPTRTAWFVTETTTRNPPQPAWTTVTP